MASVTTTKPIDLDLLSAALGGNVCIVVRHDGTANLVETDDATQTELESAVAAHVAPDRSGYAATAATLRERAAQALTANLNDAATNDGFLAITNPTNAQTLAQVKELTRQSTRQARELNGLIRLLLGRFESAD